MSQTHALSKIEDQRFLGGWPFILNELARVISHGTLYFPNTKSLKAIDNYYSMLKVKINWFRNSDISLLVGLVSEVYSYPKT